MTEGDEDAGISHRVLHAITKKAPIFCDVRCPISELGEGVWMMNNSGAAAKDGALGGWEGCFSVRQYKGYFGAGGGTFAFLNPAPTKVIGLRTGVDQDGVYGTVAIGETVVSENPNHVVDGRWPQYKVRLNGTNREVYRKEPTNHYHFAASDNPIDDACVAIEVVRLAAGGSPDDPNDKADRVQLIHDGRSIE
jgi:L-fucose isomerase-like protein